MAVGQLDRVDMLKGFSYEKIYGHFVRIKESNSNNNEAILMYSCTCKQVDYIYIYSICCAA